MGSDWIEFNWKNCYLFTINFLTDNVDDEDDVEYPDESNNLFVHILCGDRISSIDIGYYHDPNDWINIKATFL